MIIFSKDWISLRVLKPEVGQLIIMVQAIGEEDWFVHKWTQGNDQTFEPDSYLWMPFNPPPRPETLQSR